MRVTLVACALVVASCGGKDDDARPSKKRSSDDDDRPRKKKKAPGDVAISMMEEFRDDMCACKDAACAERVERDMRDAKKDFKDRYGKPSPDEIERVTEQLASLMKEYRDCKRYLDDRKPPSTDEAMRNLKKIGDRAKEAWNTEAEIPIADIPLTPSASCCTQNAGGKGKCAMTAADWSQAGWRALDFEMPEDHYFQYSYKSDGKSFTARAVGDLDCDGIQVTYTAIGTTRDGNINIRYIEPPNPD